MTDLYQKQRAMRAMRKAAMQRGVIAVLDVGTTKISCLILRFDGVNLNDEGEGVGSISGHSGFSVIGSATTASRGVGFGEVLSMRESERAIRTALQSAQSLQISELIMSLLASLVANHGLMVLQVKQRFRTKLLLNKISHAF